jgi:hypothetical protein
MDEELGGWRREVGVKLARGERCEMDEEEEVSAERVGVLEGFKSPERRVVFTRAI